MHFLYQLFVLILIELYLMPFAYCAPIRNWAEIKNDIFLLF